MESYSHILRPVSTHPYKDECAHTRASMHIKRLVCTHLCIHAYKDKCAHTRASMPPTCTAPKPEAQAQLQDHPPGHSKHSPQAPPSPMCPVPPAGKAGVQSAPASLSRHTLWNSPCPLGFPSPSILFQEGHPTLRPPRCTAIASTTSCSRPSLVGLSVPVRNPFGLAMLMPDTEQKQDLPKCKQLRQRELKIRSQKPIPFLKVSLEAKEAQHAVFPLWM